jgi:phosphate starvation-inducible membrane PsiE
MDSPKSSQAPARVSVARAFTLVEDVVYIGLGLLLTASALSLLVTGAIKFARNIAVQEPHGNIELLDRILLILLIVELLYTVQVSFREHALVPEPFLLVGLISAIRRVLLLTAEFGELHEKMEGGAQHFLIELGVLTGLIVALVASLVILRKSGASVVAHRA